MEGIFRRSWQLTKVTFEVIKKDKELFFYPILAGIFSIIFIIAMLFPIIISLFISRTGFAGTTVEYVLVFLTYLGLSVIATFFNVCTVYTVKKRLEGGNATFGESIGFGFKKIHLIFLWGLVSATVGLLLYILDQIADRAGFVGEIILNIVRQIIGMIWSIVTIFVVPSMVYYDLGPFAAIKKSVEVLKKTWGESLVRYVGFMAVEILFIILGIIIFVIGLIIAFMINFWAVLLIVILAFVYFIGVILVFNLATKVFNTALFVYADKGKIPDGFDPETMKNAFKKIEKKKGF